MSGSAAGSDGGGGAAGLPIFGGFISAMGAQQSAESSSDAALFNSRINKVNAAQALQQSAEEERQQRILGEEKIGDIRANYGASGISASQSSAVDVLQQSARNAELDALQIRHAGMMKSLAYQQGAKLDTMKSDAAITAGNYGAASAIFGGATQSFRASD